jgi:hypothetical protein
MLMSTDSHPHRRSGASWVITILAGAVLYVLSIGPVLAIAFWLREATGWSGFYAVMFLYYPLLAPGRFEPLDAYIEWWVELLGTVGPG